MNLTPALGALAAALRAEGPAVQLSSGPLPGSDPVISYVPQDEVKAGLPGGLDAPIAAVVATSGSTGASKKTLLSLDALAASSMGTAMALGGEGQWLLALPVSFVAGLQVLVRSLFAGTRPWVMDSSAGFTAAAFTAAAGELTDRIRYTSLVPTQLQRLLEAPDPATLAALQRFNAVLLGGAPASKALLAAARKANVHVVTTYGMSETCGGCIYDGVPLEGVQAKINHGRIELGGEVLASGYLNAPELTRSAFRTENGTRWYRTEDTGVLAADGTLQVTGRVDDVIMTGGLKVSAHLVAEALEQLDDVQQAFVGGVPDAQWGQKVAAMVVTTRPVDRLLAAAADVLEAHAIPKTVLVVPEIPLLPNGKPDRRAILALLAAHFPAPQ